jgi:hypothetical protein
VLHEFVLIVFYIAPKILNQLIKLTVYNPRLYNLQLPLQHKNTERLIQIPWTCSTILQCTQISTIFEWDYGILPINNTHIHTYTHQANQVYSPSLQHIVLQQLDFHVVYPHFSTCLLLICRVHLISKITHTNIPILYKIYICILPSIISRTSALSNIIPHYVHILHPPVITIQFVWSNLVYP